MVVLQSTSAGVAAEFLQRSADSPAKTDAGLQGVLPVNYRPRLRRTLVSRE